MGHIAQYKCATSKYKGHLSDFFAMTVPLIIRYGGDTQWALRQREFAAMLNARKRLAKIAIEQLNPHPVVQALSANDGRKQWFTNSLKLKLNLREKCYV